MPCSPSSAASLTLATVRGDVGERHAFEFAVVVADEGVSGGVGVVCGEERARARGNSKRSGVEGCETGYAESTTPKEHNASTKLK